jgi:hypothetical protein
MTLTKIKYPSQIRVRCSYAELATIKNLAKQKGTTISSLVRGLVQENTPDTTSETWKSAIETTTPQQEGAN